MDERYEKLAELLSDEKEAEAVISESVEETQKNLAARGLEFTVAELKEFGKAVTAANAQGELDEDALEGVSGGVILPWRPIVPILYPRISKWKRM